MWFNDSPVTVAEIRTGDITRVFTKTEIEYFDIIATCINGDSGT